MSESYGIVIGEDHTILREGLRALLTAHKEFNVIGEAEDGRDLIKSVETLHPDLALVDLTMPRMNGLEAIREIKKHGKEIKVIVLTVHSDEEYIQAALKVGADGYVLKDASHDELILAIKNVLSGKRYLSPSISEKIIDGYLEGRKSSETTMAWDTLTKREREILKLIGEGYKNREIAEFLFISLKTVEKHRSNLMRKLDLHNTAELTALAIEKGLVAR